MQLISTELEGVYIIDNFFAEDVRGSFVKTFNKKGFLDNKLNFEIRESYFSTSKKNVIRGMHFQLPPNDHEKLVYVPQGKILDVVIDLRKDSSTYKKHISVELSSANRKSIFIPRGLAHGFKSLENNTITVYNVATEYNSNSDMGIKYDSFGFDWQVIKPIISDRDKQFITLEEFNNKNPF
jgi:dTDP-4-dehydrorhamnose 3,5-epimerase/CDP-3, 6-dideoxy-D-glycero-D-glycero-4-hexulose-5-epimerase